MVSYVWLKRHMREIELFLRAGTGRYTGSGKYQIQRLLSMLGRAS